MKDTVLTSLFRIQDVQAVADRLASEANWEVLHGKAFRKAWDDFDRKRQGGEANTREKIIEPILYDVLGFDRSENDAEHAINYAGVGEGTGTIEYFFRIPGTDVPVEAKGWGKSLDRKDPPRKSPVRQGFDYAVLSNLRWFVVTNGAEWRLYKTQLKGSQSPLSACERCSLKEIAEDRRAHLRFYATFGRAAFLLGPEGLSRLDELRQRSEGWQQAIGESLYAKLVDSRVKLFRALQPQFAQIAQADLNDAVVKLLFRLLFIRFAEDTPLLPRAFLMREVLDKYEKDQKWGHAGSLFRYVQRYFAWLDGRIRNEFDIYPYDGALFDPDPVLDDPDVQLDDAMIKSIVVDLSTEAMGRDIDYSQINPRILGNLYEKFLGHVIRMKEGHPEAQPDPDTVRREGTVYTPEPVTRFLAEHCVEESLASNPQRKPWELTCLDPACGSGHFLVEFVNYVAQRSEEWDDRRSYPEWRRYVTEHCVFGVDKDPTAAMLTKLSLWINSAMSGEPFATIDTHIKCGNSLVCGSPSGFRLAAYERRIYPEKYRELSRLRKALADLETRADDDRPLLSDAESRALHREVRRALAKIDDAKDPVRQELAAALRSQWPSLAQTSPFHWEVEFAEVFEERGGFDVVVGNPPWGADVSEIADYLGGGAFQLARGQYDTYELFVELGRRLLAENGVFGFIIPDSITQSEHEPLRRMLLDNTTLTRLVRAGEGLFPSVFRAAFFLCFRNEQARDGHRVRVATLRKDDRRLLEQDTLFDPIRTIVAIVESTGHDVEQSRFRANPRCEFDILATGVDAPILTQIDSPRIEWRALTKKGRGVEIGKSGEVLQCPYCHKWDNVPRRSKGRWKPKTCHHCSRAYSYEDAANRDTIIAEKSRGKSWKPIIPGEAVNRYSVARVQSIDVSKDGINYKSTEFYKGKRILLRQTGVGVYATIDASGRFTNQSVFTWKLRSRLDPPLSEYRLEYILGVLNSRLMLYRYYMKSGDTEWRSFPRWTQELVEELPVRAIDFSNRREAGLHKEIADRVEAIIATGSPPSDHEDCQIERLVMQLYGITQPMCRRIFDVLHQVQRLRVIREMNIAEPDMLLDALEE